MASVTFLGTAPGSTVPERGHASILLDAGGSFVLLDAGEPCSQSLADLGIPLPDLDAVWITHGHSDHIGGLPMLLQGSAIAGRKDPLPLGLPSHLIGPLGQWLRAVFIAPESLLRFPLETFGWESGKPVVFRDLTVTPHPSSHLQRTVAQMGDPSIEAFLFEIVAPGQRIVYSGDLGSPVDLAPVLEAPIDVLICELAHFSLDSLIESLQPAKIGTLCLTHLDFAMDEKREEIKHRCEDELLGVDAIYLPADGERIDF
ncbi:hypothetical protein BH09VER1_BH09VER1_33800 [soil metagenome]